ncbi:MAG: PTS sugar transporter subunit IIA, partial [Gemmataceae bacterium]
WQVYDADTILEAITQREERGSTALPQGIAIPHAHRPLGDGVLAEPLVVFGKTSRPIPFGGRGEMTDLFFLVLSKEDRTHVRVLARLARLILRENFVDQLRAAETPAEAHGCILQAERELLGLQE